MKQTNKTAFTLTEVLISMGIFAVGMVLVMSVFPLGLSLTVQNAEQTIASAAADSFENKIKILAPTSSATNFTALNFRTIQSVFDLSGDGVSDSVFLYPSDTVADDGVYVICAIGKLVSSPDVRLIEFVCRKSYKSNLYRTTDDPLSSDKDDWEALPEPVKVEMDKDIDTDKPGNILKLDNDWINMSNPAWTDFIVPNSLIVADNTGDQFKVEEVLADGFFRINKFLTDADRANIEFIWLVPPAANGGNKSPAVAVYESIIEFGS